MQEKKAILQQYRTIYSNSHETHRCNRIFSSCSYDIQNLLNDLHQQFEPKRVTTLRISLHDLSLHEGPASMIGGYLLQQV
jgi:hypothetical protein